jgi:tRNA(adenine34) deaminase
MTSLLTPEYYMNEAIKEAKKAFEEGEIPVGAVMVAENRIIARGYNQTEKLNDPTAHAEMLAITAAANYLGTKYLNDCSLYVTLEPCAMCAGALYWAQLKRLVFAAPDEQRGFRKLNPALVHPKTVVDQGPLKEESEKLIRDFFRQLRKGT